MCCGNVLCARMTGHFIFTTFLFVMEKVNCKLCGEPSDPQKYDSRIGEIMEEQNVCYNCAFWLWQHECDQRDPRRRGRFAVINGSHYVLGDGKGAFQGHYGDSFTVRFNDGRVVVNNDLWHQGEIPEHLRHLFPDNAEFVKRG